MCIKELLLFVFHSFILASYINKYYQISKQQENDWENAELLHILSRWKLLALKFIPCANAAAELFFKLNSEAAKIKENTMHSLHVFIFIVLLCENFRYAHNSDDVLTKPVYFFEKDYILIRGFVFADNNIGRQEVVGKERRCRHENAVGWFIGTVAIARWPWTSSLAWLNVVHARRRHLAGTETFLSASTTARQQPEHWHFEVYNFLLLTFLMKYLNFLYFCLKPSWFDWWFGRKNGWIRAGRFTDQQGESIVRTRTEAASAKIWR